MDDCFPVDWQSDLFWFEAPPAEQSSAFVPYSTKPTNGENNIAGNLGFGNVNKRMMEFLKKSCHGRRDLDGGGLEREKCFRHMMNERMRREKQKQSYHALHSMLPKGTKNDKNSIVQTAARTIEELKRYEAMLERRNLELEMQLERVKGTVIRVRVANPSCGIDSMLAVLKFLKSLGVNATAIRTTFSTTEFSAQFAIDSQMGAGEVERALEITLSEVERKFRGQ